MKLCLLHIKVVACLYMNFR